MVDQEQEGATGTPPRGSDTGPAVAYYGLVGLIGAALAAWFVFSLLEAFLGGYCPIGRPGELSLCGHSLRDLIAPVVASVVGATLLPTARRLRRNPSRLGPLGGVGVVVGVAVAVLPIVLILWAADFSSDFNIFGSKVSTAGLVLLFAVPLLWALQSAVIVWRQAARPEEPSGIGGARPPDQFRRLSRTSRPARANRPEAAPESRPWPSRWLWPAWQSERWSTESGGNPRSPSRQWCSARPC